MTDVSCFFSEVRLVDLLAWNPDHSCYSQVLATAVLLIVILAISDKQNGPPPAGLVPLALFIAVLGLGASLGMETGELVCIHFFSLSKMDMTIRLCPQPGAGSWS